MIGVSLPLDWFSRPAQLDSIFPVLKKHGVGSIELRTVRPHHDAQTVLEAARIAWKAGFQITVHGSVSAVETAVQEIFTPLQSLLGEMRQESLNVTIHPIVGDNAGLLTALSDHILAHQLPVTIALENNRLMPDKTQGDSAALVLEAVKAANRENVGICFDMGHYAYYVKKNCPDTPQLLPDKEFFSHVIHTHIHGLKELRTHFPLGAYPLPLKEILEKLSFGYFGVYNLELDFPRITPEWTPEAALERSLPVLQSHMHHCARLYDTVAEQFDHWFESALAGWHQENNSFSLIHSSAYLFHTNGCKWGMDIAFRNARFLAKTPAKAAQLLQQLQLMVLSHGHRDHYEESTIRSLAGNDTMWLVPDFLEERTLELGVPREKLVLAHPGQPVTLFGIRFLPFESSHYRPDGKGVREYGYYVTAPGCPSLAFPVDIRDFSKKPELPPADYCFANVWLKDNSADPESWQPVVPQLASYMLHFSRKNIFLTHLYEDGRPDNRMWRAEHAEAVRAEILARDGQTKVTIPARGETILL